MSNEAEEQGRVPGDRKGSAHESVARYEKVVRIGKGTYGIVYLAKDRETGEKVALKRLLQHEHLQDLLAYAKWEFNMLQEVKHLNIVEVKHLVTSDYKGVWLVYEYCEHDLFTVGSALKYPYTEAEVKCIIWQILEGVNHLHQCGYMHRDLKCSNILLTKAGIVKLCDFGMTKKFREDGLSLPQERETDKSACLRVQHTPGVTTGPYSAPEVLFGSESYNEKCDLWAVGCIMAELIKGDILFLGETDLEILSKWTRILGSPHHAWLGFAELNHARLLKATGNNYDIISKEFWEITELGQDFLRSLMQFDPGKRSSAAEALQHPYLKEAPLPVIPSDLPRVPSSLESEAKKRMKGAVANIWPAEKVAPFLAIVLYRSLPFGQNAFLNSAIIVILINLIHKRIKA